MCLILFALNHHPDYPLILAANRDENYERPTAAAHFWTDQTGTFAGRDLKAGGSWMGINKNGRFAAVTNVRDGAKAQNDLLSRGELISDFLNSDQSIDNFVDQLQSRQQRYAGFNLLLGKFSSQQSKMVYFSNRYQENRPLEAGLYGLSNGTLNQPWPKVTEGVSALKSAIDASQKPESIINVLLDRQVAEDSRLPDTGIKLEQERLLSSRFINTPTYGTRACTVMTLNKHNEVCFYEQEYLSTGCLGELTRQTFTLNV